MDTTVAETSCSKSTTPSSWAVRRRPHFRLPVKDKYFSRVHFLVEVNPPCCRLVAMASKKEAYVRRLRGAATARPAGDAKNGATTIIPAGWHAQMDNAPTPPPPHEP